MNPKTHHYWTHQPFENSAIPLKSTQNAKRETEDKKSSDGMEGMDVDDVNRDETSKDKLTTGVEDKEDEPNMLKVGVASSESKSAAKKEKSLQRDFFETLIGKQLQDEGEKKDEQAIDTKNLQKTVSKTSQRCPLMTLQRIMDPLLGFLEAKKLTRSSR